MSKRLKWIRKDPTNPSSDVVAAGDKMRLYRITMKEHDGSEWLAWLALGDLSGDEPPTAAVARGWARTLDEAKQIAEEWEESLRKHESWPPTEM